MPSCHCSIQKLENRCCNNSFPISIKFGNQLGHHVPRVVIGKSSFFFVKVSKSVWKISFDVPESPHCHVRSEVSGRDIQNTPSFCLSHYFSNSCLPPFPTAPEKIIIPMKMKNSRGVTGLIEQMPNLFLDFILYSFNISSYI
jgi:hypothetical protein